MVKKLWQMKISTKESLLMIVVTAVSACLISMLISKLTTINNVELIFSTSYIVSLIAVVTLAYNKKNKKIRTKVV